MAAIEPSPIPRKLLFDNPERTAVRISPDGARIAYLAPVDGVLNVWVGDTEAVVRDPAAARPVTRDRGRGVRIYHWAYDGAHLLYLQDDGGDENWRLHRVDVERRGRRPDAIARRAGAHPAAEPAATRTRVGGPQRP
jgi:Tol biopolymer transport system component